MGPNDIFVTYWSISEEEMMQIFPWLGDLVVNESKPKSRRGRKPKAHRVSDNAIEMKASYEK